MNCGISEVFEHTYKNKKMGNFQIKNQREWPMTAT